ncbi:hypothetical protein K440DRAFT_626341 [Wilcoxina mikolae CBS 423.85]|nr:hypothetical protein K440DRAFT_626341 [Wilcoxina mikolae CBS 423.85]
MPSKEHNRTAQETEMIIRSQLWQGGFHWGAWGQSEEGIKCRQDEGIDRQSNGTVTREAPDDSLWIDQLSPEKPMLVIEIAVSEPYDHVRDKCEMWLTQHDGLIKFAIAIKIEQWKHREEKQAALKELEEQETAGNRKRTPFDEAEPSNSRSKRSKSEGSSSIPRAQEVYDDYEVLTDIEELEEVLPDNPEDPTPITHKYKCAKVSVFRSARFNRRRVMQTVINQIPIWPEPPTETWKLSWNEMNVCVPGSHKDKIIEVSFEALREFLAKEIMPRDRPPAEGPWAWLPDSQDSIQASTASSGISDVPNQVWEGPRDPPPGWPDAPSPQSRSKRGRT